MKKFLSIALTVVMLFTLTACGDGKKSGDKSDNKEDMVKVGYVINSLNDTFQRIILDTAKKYAKENNIELLVEDAQEDVAKQHDKIEALLKKGVKGLVIVPTDTTAMEPITKIAMDENIPLAYVNRNPFSGKEDQIPDNVYYVGANEKQAGRLQMEFVGKKLSGEGGVAILMGILNNDGVIQRTQGVEETMKKEFPKMTILTEETGRWQRDQGLVLTENFIANYQDKLNAIISNNDEMALGAIQALKTNNKLKDVLVVGVDCTPDAIASIKAGELAATIFQDPKQGEVALKMVVDRINGKEPEEKVQYIPFKLVTPENIKDFEH